MSLFVDKRELSHEAPPPGGDVSLQSSALITIWVLFGITSVVMILRVFAQVKVLRKLGLDDGFMILAWICQAINCALNAVSVCWGIGRHDIYLTPEQYVNAIKYGLLAIPWGALCAMFGRISFIVFLLVFVMSVSYVRKRLLWALIVIQVVFNIPPVIVTFVQCQPVSRVWDPFEPGSCWNPAVVEDFGYVQGAVNAATDLCLTVIGAALVASLNVWLCAKISLSVLLSLSIIAMVAAILKTIKIQDADRPDLTYHFASWIHWYLAENAIVIITASLPKMRPLFILLRQKHAESKYRQRCRSSEDVERSAPSKLSKYLSLGSQSGSGSKTHSSISRDIVSRYHSSLSGTTSEHRSIYSLPRRTRRRSANICLTSLSRPSTEQGFYRVHSPCPSENFVISTTNHYFLPPHSARLTSRTVISGGGPVPPSVPASVLSSAAPSGRSSRASLREQRDDGDHNHNLNQGALPQISVDAGGHPFVPSGPFCIWETRDFVLEFENAESSSNNNNDNNLEAGLPTHDMGANQPQYQYNESEAQELQLYDVGAILGQDQDDDHNRRGDTAAPPPAAAPAPPLNDT
ncbi:hypothetical protein VTN77DRAFT_1264 [Rasamsonia byssochlamydoides]|uniref:uncharacterized protein n=1 Tax=Rasamsonia byssochlamydoides TaxID=89139 RepID=UPI003743ED60